MKVFVADKISEKGVDYLRGISGIDVDFTPGLSQQDVTERLKDADGLIVRSAVKVTREMIESAPKLKVIGRAGIGVDNIDVEAATERGVVVLNTPDSNATTTAELAVAHMFSLSRNLPAASASVRANEWKRAEFMGREITGKTVGIVGYGTIGRIAASRFKGLQMNVVAYDPFVTAEKFEQDGVQPKSLEELLSISDYVSLHCPLIAATKHLMNAERFALMKQGSRLINCARGGLVEESALIEALSSGHLAGAALDVYESEPPKDSPLLSLDNVVFTPHLGASTHEAQVAVGVAIAEQLAHFLVEGEAINAINLPRISRDVLNRLQPYLQLSRSLGRLLSAMSSTPVCAVKVNVNGQAAELDPHPIAVETLVGLLSGSMSVPVNSVNAESLAKRQGISLTESRSQEVHDYVSLVTVIGECDGEQIELTGTLLGETHPRLVGYNDYEVESTLEGTILITHHSDKPGVIGAVGDALGDGNINITRMHVGDSSSENKAMAVIGISSPLDDKTFEAVKAIPAIERACQVEL
ncbi:MAG: phosphoglycerate dehydrogenase [Gammaproteobacteria bacterium]|nr:phosphoglycerate dehydrogenase [Gammaproteobacteria bacterium]